MHPCLALKPPKVTTPCLLVSQLGQSPRLSYFTSSLLPLRPTPTSIPDSTYSLPTPTLRLTSPIIDLRFSRRQRRRRQLTSAPAFMLPENSLTADICATAISSGVAVFLLLFWEQTAKLGIFDQKLNRKLVHISIGLACILCWPLFSSGYQGSLLASLIPGLNIIRMLLVGFGIMKDEGAVKSMSRFNDYRELRKGPLYYAFTSCHRELRKGPLYYATTLTLASAVYWRTSPVAIAIICNLCAGDGFADVVGRRFGSHKLPYNKNKSIAGSVAMASAGFLSSLGCMFYFSKFGFVEISWDMVFGFLVLSLASALVESLPISTKLDDNLTVPLTSMLLGSFVF